MNPPAYEDKPSYSPSLEFYGLALYKIERATPWSSDHSSLQPVVLELNSNQLRIYKLKADNSMYATIRALYKFQNRCDGKNCGEEWDSNESDCDKSSENTDNGFLHKMKKNVSKAREMSIIKSGLLSELSLNKFLMEPTDSYEQYATFAAKFRGPIIRSFTLLNLAVGRAPFTTLLRKDRMLDVKKMCLLDERNVLRLRIEHMQILLHIWSFHGMVQWFRNLVIGRDLSLLIDSRKVLNLRSLSSLARYEIETTVPIDDQKRASTSRLGSISSDSISDLSLFSSSSSNTSDTKVSEANTVDILGQKVQSLENFYIKPEKKYIAHCIPKLKPYDKWLGHKMALSNLDLLLPAIDRVNLKDDGEMFMLARDFNKVAKSLVTLVPDEHRPCREFHVLHLGLYNCKANEVDTM